MLALTVGDHALARAVTHGEHVFVDPALTGQPYFIMTQLGHERLQEQSILPRGHSVGGRAPK